MPDAADSVIGATTPGRYGPAGRGLVLHEATMAVAWNLQGDPSRTSIVADVRRMFGASLPLAPNTTCRDSAHAAAFWLGPRSWLLIGDASAAKGAMASVDASRDALEAGGAALFDVSASRIAYALRGVDAPAVLARGCPLDLDARVFAPGRCAQSLFGRIPALFYRHETTAAFTVMVARSMAADAWHSLCVAASTDGYDVEAAAPFRAD